MSLEGELHNPIIPSTDRNELLQPHCYAKALQNEIENLNSWSVSSAKQLKTEQLGLTFHPPFKSD